MSTTDQPDKRLEADPKPELAVNRHGQTVADALNVFISAAATDFVGGVHIDIATAYFNLGGYELLADSLDQVIGARILLGAEPGKPENRPRRLSPPTARESVNPRRAAAVRLRRALQDQGRDLSTERDLLGFSHQIEVGARRLVEWLRRPDVEVRRLQSRFLHGKAFLISDRSHGVMAGSSNFTRAGLAYNAELNLGNYSSHVVRQAQDWFEELWDEAVPYDLAALFDARFEPHSPQIIYLRMLWERYRAELNQQARSSDAIRLTQFQKDGLDRARAYLRERNGVLIADEVGLGKTFLAGALIEEAELQRRQRVLVVAPATLRDGPWRAFRAKYNLHMELVSFEDLAADRRLNPEHARGEKLQGRIDEYALIVVDEAHNLRNPATQRADALRRLLAGERPGSPPKKLVLLTATPVNNSLWDLYNVLGFFVRNDAAFADIGIPSMRDRFAEAMAQNPDDLTPEQLFDIIDAVAVRRPRSFVKRYYSNDVVPIDGIDTQITFPTPRVLKMSYDLDAVLPGFFDRIARALDPDADPDDPEVLSLATYEPSRYLGDSADIRPDDHYERQLAGLLRSGILKRFESSPHAFANTCERMAKRHDAFLSLLERGRVATGDALTDWAATDTDDLDKTDAFLDHITGLTDDAAAYDTDLLSSRTRADRDLLRSLAEAGRVTRAQDPTLAELEKHLVEIAFQADSEGIGADNVRDRRKVLIFSYFADTVDWVFEHLEQAVLENPGLACYQDRIASLAGSSGNADKKPVLWGFAPRTTDARPGDDDDLYDIVVTTDVLAEGVNLQQARHIINYDLPWNPMRLVQRHGRIDRIGSAHSEVFIRCVFPDSRLDDLLNLEERLRRKIKQAAASVGIPQVLPGQPKEGPDIAFAETREEIERIRNENPNLFERGGTRRGSLSGEDFRQQLRQAIEHGLRDDIERLPWGSGSAMVSPELFAAGAGPGYVFCARVGDWEQPEFRYVMLADTDQGTDSNTNASAGLASVGEPVIVSDTLICLDRARPPQGHDTPRALDDLTHRRAFSAWDIARANIVHDWNLLADKKNLEPKVPLALRRAAELLRSHPPADATSDEVERAIDSLSAPYPERTVRSVRAAMSGADNPTEQAEVILTVVGALGLQPYEPPKPLPEITAEDVNLICWLALQPAETHTVSENRVRT